MSKKNKKEKVKKTPKQKAARFFKVILIILVIIALIVGIIAIGNKVTVSSEREFAKNTVQPVAFEEQLKPELDESGYYTFTTDRDFKIMQLTDIHIGSGLLSAKKDNMAINAVAAMISEEKPDLVIVTGDVAYPVPYQALSLNNKSGAVTFASLMERLGVYWCLAFGNHDTEAYSFFSREDISKIYENKKEYPHCLFQSGPKDVDGCGNYLIKVKNTKGAITQSLFIFDSHSYTDGDYFGIQWKYDAVHKNQLEWYKKQVQALTKENNGVTPKSLAFYHIPPIEENDVFKELKDSDFKDTENVKYKYGKIGESNEAICSGTKNYGAFEAFCENGTQGVFFGHDHLNNLSANYKGVQLTYGYSIDYLAYPGIYKYGLQRGCTVITVKPDGSFDNYGENYYQDKYQAVNAKETVELEKEMSEDKENAGGANPFADN
ncbi:MAG: metallophosphoesterase [Eubacterium sp.]|nr:metallophosphoesterase [Eubacterium sp.]